MVVGLDGTEYTANAIRVGIEAIRTFGGTLIGVAVVDSPAIEASARGAGVGAYEYARRAREQRLSDARAKAHGFLDAFEQECKVAGIRHELAYHDAAPFQALVDEGRFADGIVTGTRTFFHFETQDEPGDTLRRLMEAGVCPVVAVPRDADLPQRAVVAFDGSIQAARALRAYINFASATPEARSVHLLYVSEGGQADDAAGGRQLIRAQQYIAGWGFEVDVINRTGRPTDVIAEVAQQQAPCVLVMGAIGRHGRVHKLIFGSTTLKLIEREIAPMFVYH
jgi:nucleotide-binding universal stress UspA family protein